MKPGELINQAVFHEMILLIIVLRITMITTDIWTTSTTAVSIRPSNWAHSSLM